MKLFRYCPVVLLSAAYLLFCLLIGLLLPKCATDCDDGASTHLSWTTDFFVAVIFGMCSLRLYCKTSHKRMTSLVFLLLCLAYLIKGLLGKNFGEHGINTSGDRRNGFYVWIVFLYICWTGSALLYAFLVHASLIKTNENTDGFLCGFLETRILFGMMVLSFLAITTGCIWNVMTLWSTNNDNSTETISIRIVKYGQLLWHGFYSAFLITAAYVWRAVAKQTQITIGGLSPNFSTAGIVLSQIVIACILIAYAIDIANNSDIVGPNSSQEYTYAEIFFNLCMLVSGYFIQSALIALFPLSVDDFKEEAGTDDDSSEEGSGENERDDALEQIESQIIILEGGEKQIYTEQKDSSKVRDSSETLPTVMTHGKVISFFVGSPTASAGGNH